MIGGAKMEMEKLQAFLEQSLVPSIQELMKINVELAQHATEPAALVEAVKTDLEQTGVMENAIRTLSESVTALSKPMGELIESVNRSNRLLEEQNHLFGMFKDALMENNARMNVLSMALAVQAKDPGLVMPGESRE